MRNYVILNSLVPPFFPYPWFGQWIYFLTCLGNLTTIWHYRFNSLSMIVLFWFLWERRFFAFLFLYGLVRRSRNKSVWWPRNFMGDWGFIGFWRWIITFTQIRGFATRISWFLEESLDSSSSSVSKASNRFFATVDLLLLFLTTHASTMNCLMPLMSLLFLKWGILLQLSHWFHLLWINLLICNGRRRSFIGFTASVTFFRAVESILWWALAYPDLGE